MAGGPAFQRESRASELLVERNAEPLAQDVAHEDGTNLVDGILVPDGDGLTGRRGLLNLRCPDAIWVKSEKISLLESFADDFLVVAVFPEGDVIELSFQAFHTLNLFFCHTIGVSCELLVVFASPSDSLCMRR